MYLLNNLWTIIGTFFTVLAFYCTHKSARISSSKNDFEQWIYLIDNLEKMKNRDKISQYQLIKSISFLKKLSFIEAYFIARISVQNSVDFFALRKIIYLRNKKLIRYTYEDKTIKLHLTSIARNKYSIILFETANGFKKFYWFIFIAFHSYILFTLFFYNIELQPLKKGGEINICGIMYLILLATTEIFMLFEINTRETIEKIHIK